MICTRKHTKYQPDDEHWKCPKCGEKKNFSIDNGCEIENESDCEKLHVDDCCTCENCDYGALGKAVANALMKQNNQTVCPTCKGKGTIQKVVERR